MKKFLINKGRLARMFSFLIIFAFIIIAISLVVNRAKAAPASTIYLDPATELISSGQSFSLTAKINPGTNQVTAVEVHVSFDGTKLNMTGITASPAFSSVLQAGQFDNSAGTASIIVGVPAASPPQPVTTDTPVATLSFTAVGQSSTSTVSFTAETQAAALNETGNVITTRNSSEVTIGRKYGNTDFANLATDWLQTKSSPADVNSDGVINSKDLGIMMSNWQQ